MLSECPELLPLPEPSTVWPSFKEWQINRAPTIEQKINLLLRWKFIEYMIALHSIVPYITYYQNLIIERYGEVAKIAAQFMEEADVRH